MVVEASLKALVKTVRVPRTVLYVVGGEERDTAPRWWFITKI